jgi:hypothetical protein
VMIDHIIISRTTVVNIKEFKINSENIKVIEYLEDTSSKEV